MTGTSSLPDDDTHEARKHNALHLADDVVRCMEACDCQLLVNAGSSAVTSRLHVTAGLPTTYPPCSPPTGNLSRRSWPRRKPCLET